MANHLGRLLGCLICLSSVVVAGASCVVMPYVLAGIVMPYPTLRDNFSRFYSDPQPLGWALGFGMVALLGLGCALYVYFLFERKQVDAEKSKGE